MVCFIDLVFVEYECFGENFYSVCYCFEEEGEYYVVVMWKGSYVVGSFFVVKVVKSEFLKVSVILEELERREDIWKCRDDV